MIHFSADIKVQRNLTYNTSVYANRNAGLKYSNLVKASCVDYAKPLIQLDSTPEG